MLFNSYQFAFIFLPAALLGYFALNQHRSWAAAWLGGISLVFYAWWSIPFTFLMIGSIVFNYFCGLILQKESTHSKGKNLVLYFAVIANLSLLFFYKYLFPLLHWLSSFTLNWHFTTADVMLPLGISFFTFTQIGYIIDCKAGIVKSSNPYDYILFVTFFPHLIAGPILHHREIMPQFLNRETYRFNLENLTVGLTLFGFGIFKKVVIADSYISTVSHVFQHPNTMNGVEAWIGALSYSLQLYFDFSGYSDMAVGLARMFGIRFPANFNSPYKAKSIIDFWQRWHMTLTRYLNLYLYNPIALYMTRLQAKNGMILSRKQSVKIKSFLLKIATPTLVTMGLAGIWHGAGAQFLVFGLLNGCYLVINQAWRVWGPKVSKKSDSTGSARLINLSYWIMTYGGVLVTHVIFRADNLSVAGKILRSMLGLTKNQRSLEPGHFLKSISWVIVGYLIVLTLPNVNQVMASYFPVLDFGSKTKPTQQSLNKISRGFTNWAPRVAWGLIVGLGFGIAMVISISEAPSEFLYYRF